MRLLSLLLTLPTLAFAQAPVVNPGFELGEKDAVPLGWIQPPAVAKAGFGATTVDQQCHTGDRCALILGSAEAPATVFGNLVQSLPANGYTSRHVRLRSAVRVAGLGTRAQMWRRIDRADHTMAFLENMSSRPITSAQWQTYDIEADVPSDASTLVFGVMLYGGGKAWVDDVTLAITGEVRPDPKEPARPLTSQGLANLTAFAKLYGYVRFFHPSDQAAKTDWDAFAIEGVRDIEKAASQTELIAALEKRFHPIAPAVRLFPSGSHPESAVRLESTNQVRYQHQGVGLSKQARVYKSERVTEPVANPGMAPFEADLIPGIKASVPLIVAADDRGTLPHIDQPAETLRYERSGSDRATRLADVIICWNIFQHFYPYFDVVKTDWNAELPKALRRAATDAGSVEFTKTLRLLVAALKDGHGNVIGPDPGSWKKPSVSLDWIEGNLLVTRVAAGAPEDIHPGDKVLKLDGRPVRQAAAEVESLISGATSQWIHWRSKEELSYCGSKIALELESYAEPHTVHTVELPCLPVKQKAMETYSEPRPEKITELEPGILYVDLDRVTDADWQAVVPRLAAAKGIIFDMRGYSSGPGISSLAHLTDTTIRSAKWNIASAKMPDRLDSPFTESGWDVKPVAPYFSARRVFLTDGRAISYAETVMGIVERYKLGEIVGGPTAGTNGNVNPFLLPGGYRIYWTGMKVLKHDGSVHHGVGIQPTVPVERTRKGVAEGKDELLLRGLEVVKAAR